MADSSKYTLKFAGKEIDEILERAKDATSLTLLWTNSSPGNAMEGSTAISVSDMNQYKFIGIIPICNSGDNLNVGGMKVFEVSDQTVNLSSVSFKSDYPEVQARAITISKFPNRLTVGEGCRFDYLGNHSDNKACVPYKVYGIK